MHVAQNLFLWECRIDIISRDTINGVHAAKVNIGLLQVGREKSRPTKLYKRILSVFRQLVEWNVDQTDIEAKVGIRQNGTRTGVSITDLIRHNHFDTIAAMHIL